MKTSEKTTFDVLLDRVKSSKSMSDLLEADRKITRHYINGTITEAQLRRLDVKIMGAIAAL